MKHYNDEGLIGIYREIIKEKKAEIERLKIEIRYLEKKIKEIKGRKNKNEK